MSNLKLNLEINADSWSALCARFQAILESVRRFPNTELDVKDAGPVSDYKLEVQLLRKSPNDVGPLFVP